MKYWRGYLVALILFIASWALLQFAATHTVLMDMVYPYMTRLVQTSLAGWSSGVSFCVWQVFLLVFGAGIAASIVLMVVLKWNPVQWFGWVMAAVALIMFFNAGLQGMNQYTGSIAADVRFKNGDCTVISVEDAANYYLDQAEAAAAKASKSYDLEELNKLAANGFEKLTYEEGFSIFAGSTLPVKELSWSGLYKGKTGITVALTGEAAVNTKTPEELLPYAICKEMCSRMSISKEPDVHFAAILACINNEDPRFQYAGYLMAYIQCVDALKGVDSLGAKASLGRLEKAPNKVAAATLEQWYKFVGKNVDTNTSCQLLTNWYLQTVLAELRPEQEQTVTFDPTDTTDSRLSGLVE